MSLAILYSRAQVGMDAPLVTVEVHLSNPAKREGFRKVSLLEDVVVCRISGAGGYGYVLALLAILHHLRKEGDRGRE